MKMPPSDALSARLPKTKNRPSCPQLMTAVTPSESTDTMVFPIGILTSSKAITNWMMTARSTVFHGMYLRSHEIRNIRPKMTMMPVKFSSNFMR